MDQYEQGSLPPLWSDWPYLLSSLVSGGSAFAAIGNRQIRKAKILLTLHCLNKLFQDQYHHGLHQMHLPAT